MELGDNSDNEEQTIPDIIISRSSIPDVERTRNIRMVPMLEEHEEEREEESETDSSKESGAGDDDDEDLRQEIRPPSDINIEAAETKMDDSVTTVQAEVQASQSPVQESHDSLSLTKSQAEASVNVFPAPNVEEFLSEYEDATEDEQVLVADQAHQFKADTAAFEHLESATANEQDSTDKFCESQLSTLYDVLCHPW